MSVSESTAAAAAARTHRRTRGYVEIATASLILGTSGALLQLSTMPVGLLLVLRMALAGLVLAPIFLLTGGVAEVRRSGRFWRLVLIGVVVAFELLFYFASIRLSNVATGIALEYMAPVYVAFVAPWVLHTRRERSDMVAVGVAALGMAFIVLPSLSASGSHLSAGVACGTVAGAMYAVALLLTKSVGRGVRGTTLTLFHCICTTILLAPLALWQATASHYHWTLEDAVIVVVMGVVYTALCFSLFTDGIRFVRIEHAGILGYLEPVTAPLWALLLVGEHPPLSTWLGGALVIGAGALAIASGKAEAEVPA